MIRNMGSADRMIRILLAVLIVIAYLMGLVTGTIGIILIVIATIIFLTGIVGTCPLYLPFRISTRNRKLTPDQGMHGKESSF